MTALRDCGVRFIADPHHYETADGTWLDGITATLLPAVFGDYTENIPAPLLAAAAERGTAIHRSIQDIDDGTSFPTTPEEGAYVRLRDTLGLRPLASEYIITDGRHFATAIDKVYEGDIIADVKTTADEHYPQWALQLSWEAAYYERVNKRRVAAAYIFHLPKDGAAHIITVRLVPARIITALTAAYLAGRDVTAFAPYFDVPFPVPVKKAWMKIRRMEQQRAAAAAHLAEIEEGCRKMKDLLAAAMDERGIKRWTYHGTTLTRVLPYTRETFDSKALRAADPATYEKYLRQTTVKGSLRITLKDADDQQLLTNR